MRRVGCQDGRERRLLWAQCFTGCCGKDSRRRLLHGRRRTRSRAGEVDFVGDYEASLEAEDVEGEEEDSDDEAE